jgi:2-methylcitrate dehydratase PrpD
MGHGVALARFASGITWRTLDAQVRAKVLDHVVDTVGTMYAGIRMQACREALGVVAGWGSADEATVAGEARRYPAPSAAFLNGLRGRIHTFDDTYEPGTVHPGSAVVSAALALAEKHGVDGPTFLAAVLAGYEVSTRVAAAVSPGHYAAGFHNTGTCNAFGAAAAAARALGLDGDALAETLGLAGATAAGLRQHQIDGSMLDSAFHGARAAQSGVMVAQLRAAGIRGPAGILDGPLGFCAVMAPGHDVTRLDAELGSRYEFMQTTIKPYPTCRFAHGPIEAAIGLKKQYAIDPAGIESIEIATFRQSIEVSDRPRIQNAFDRTVSHQHGVAVGLLEDRVALDAFEEGAPVAAPVEALMQRVRVVHDAELEKRFPKQWPHRVTIAMKDGRQHSTLSEYPPGRVTPVPSSTVDAKFLDHVTPYLGAAQSARTLASLRGCADARDMRDVAAGLRPATVAHA